MDDRIRMTNAVKRALSLVGLSPSVDSLRSAVNPFLEDLPDPVVVTPTPSPGPGEPATYQMTADEPHIQITTGDGSHVVFVAMPDISQCANGTKFSIDLTQGEGGATYAVLTGSGISILIFPGIRYQFVVANGNNLSMMNDWVLWGTSIARIAGILGGSGDTLEDGSVWGAIGTTDQEASATGNLHQMVKDLQERIAVLEGGT